MLKLIHIMVYRKSNNSEERKNIAFIMSPIYAGILFTLFLKIVRKR